MVAIIYFACVFSHAKEIDKKAIKKNAQDRMDQYEEELQNDEHKYPLERKWNSRLSDISIVSTLIAAMVYIIAFLIFSSILGYDEAESKHIFPIVAVDDQSYAIVYNTGDTVILEECTIEDTTIKIYTDKQKIISVDGVEYEIREFSSVSAIGYSSELEE